MDIYTVRKLVKTVRDDLTKEYDVIDKHSAYYNYYGLCDIAHGLLCAYIAKYNKRQRTNYRLMHIYGEQQHVSSIHPSHWRRRHTWGVLTNRNCKQEKPIYVDITSSQFQWLYDDIPDFYVSHEPPKWYRPDRQNPYWFWMQRSKIIAGFVRKCQQLWYDMVRLKYWIMINHGRDKA